MLNSEQSHLNILCVDDDPDDVEVFREAVELLSPDHRCIVVYDGNSAIKLLSSGFIPDLTFLDINMPHMGGKETLTGIRAIKGVEKMPIIMYSTSINPNDIPEYKKLGATNFLIKPGKFQELVEALTTIFNTI